VARFCIINTDEAFHNRVCAVDPINKLWYLHK